MEIVPVESYGDLSREAARKIAHLVLTKPSAVIALPTGETPVGMYRVLATWVKEGILDLSQAVVFNLDEYLEVPPSHPASFRRYMEERFLDHVRVGAHYIPDSDAEDPEAECRRYEGLIRDHGGLDLAILGLGPNGHIAFNEPGTPFESLTHPAELAPETRTQQATHFGGLDKVPRRAITMGIRTIMNAREILLLVAGEAKAGILQRALLGPVTTEVPASVLQLHPNVTVILDQEAASKLSRREFYLIVRQSSRKEG
jgi:glucosamine-6-phosphate deaminase